MRDEFPTSQVFLNEDMSNPAYVEILDLDLKPVICALAETLLRSGPIEMVSFGTISDPQDRNKPTNLRYLSFNVGSESDVNDETMFYFISQLDQISGLHTFYLTAVLGGTFGEGRYYYYDREKNGFYVYEYFDNTDHPFDVKERVSVSTVIQSATFIIHVTDDGSSCKVFRPFLTYPR